VLALDRPLLCPVPAPCSTARPSGGRAGDGSGGGDGSHGRDDRLRSRVALKAADGGARAERPPQLAVRRRRLDLAAGVNGGVAGLARVVLRTGWSRA
jgi:hypothetical protein